mmetsp:Transcript_25037/g.43761  ORF Transcript_25037/g.43761 Transcript_25037/m.43761 type:complete len:241 (+) Transcript_25037:561-1283(+)
MASRVFIDHEGCLVIICHLIIITSILRKGAVENDFLELWIFPFFHHLQQDLRPGERAQQRADRRRRPPPPRRAARGSRRRAGGGRTASSSPPGPCRGRPGSRRSARGRSRAGASTCPPGASPPGHPQKPFSIGVRCCTSRGRGPRCGPPPESRPRSPWPRRCRPPPGPCPCRSPGSCAAPCDQGSGGPPGGSYRASRSAPCQLSPRCRNRSASGHRPPGWPGGSTPRAPRSAPCCTCWRP